MMIPADPDDLALVQDVLREELEREVRLDDPWGRALLDVPDGVAHDGRHPVKYGKKSISLYDQNCMFVLNPLTCTLVFYPQSRLFLLSSL